jgi:hypothetical protein
VIAKAALPNLDNLPFLLQEKLPCTRVAPNVLGELLLPKVRASGGRCRELAIAMSMPEATVNEDARTELRQDDIGSPVEITNVQAISKAKAMEEPAHCQLRLGILAPNARHHSGTCGGAYDIHQFLSSFQK